MGGKVAKNRIQGDKDKEKTKIMPIFLKKFSESLFF